MATSLNINGETRTVDAADGTPLLWVIRDELKLTGTKFGCGVASCGACTVHLDGVAARTCVLPVSAVGAKKITTIEGLAQTHSSGALHPVQQAWIAEGVQQCGYCQAGQIMTASALLRRVPDPSDKEIREEMSGNLCRCGTYGRIHRAITRVAQEV
ncbi:MAG: (2Fe-2S)-binding protein [Rhodobacteraceae bacterium]|nr:(2Fe-2S)-binding protein [Paracoccaceae bacterium]